MSERQKIIGVINYLIRTLSEINCGLSLLGYLNYSALDLITQIARHRERTG